MRVRWLGALLLGTSSAFAAADILRASAASCHWSEDIRAARTDLPLARHAPRKDDGGPLPPTGAEPAADPDPPGDEQPPADAGAGSAADESSGGGGSSAAGDVSIAADEAERRLIAAFEAADAGRLRTALRDTQSLLLRAKPPVISRLEEVTRARRKIELSEWLARLRIDAELAAARGRVVRISYATPYEAPALGRLLQAEADQRLAREFAGLSLHQWLTGEEEYSELSPDASQMATELRLVAGFLSARLRHDPALRVDRAARAQVLRTRDDAARLVAQITDLPGFTSLGTIDDPTRSAQRGPSTPPTIPAVPERPVMPTPPNAPATAPVAPEGSGPG
ncbi:MAG: hypothetical protein IPM64_07150 [Phycisphaerales bacterium]|nr:hypothetical protein [Phycisphaerales bacterium]